MTQKEEDCNCRCALLTRARWAYISAGYKHKKDSTTDVNACRLLKNDKVQARLAEISKEVENNSIADIKEMQR